MTARWCENDRKIATEVPDVISIVFQMAAFMSSEGKERIIFAQLEALKEIRFSNITW